MRRHSRGQALVEAAVIIPILLLLAAGIATVSTMLGAHSQLQTAVQDAALTAAREQVSTCPETGGTPDATTSQAFNDDMDQGNLTAGEFTVQSLTLQCVNDGDTSLGSIGCSYEPGTLGPGGASGCIRGDFIVVTASISVRLTWLPGFMSGLGAITMNQTAGAQRQPFESVG